MDRNYLIELFGGRDFPDGTPVMDHIEGIIEHQKVFMETCAKVRKKMMFTFPIITYSLLYQDEKFVDEEFARWCCDHNNKWYDANFYVGNSVTSLSNCCRLISDTTKLDAFINSIGGTSLSIGSIKVNTINLRRIALESYGDEEEYLSILRKRIELCLIALDRVRHILKRNIEKGLLPNYTHSLLEMEKQYNTIGCTSMFETLEEFNYIETDVFGNKSYGDKAMSFATRIMDEINAGKDAFIKDKDYSVNLEFVPKQLWAHDSIIHKLSLANLF